MKTKLYTFDVNFYTLLFKEAPNALLSIWIVSLLFLCTSDAAYAQASPFSSFKKNNTSSNEELKKRQTSLHTLKQSSNVIWFEKNDGQFPDKKIKYGFRTSFGMIAVFDDKLRMVARQSEKEKTTGYQVVDITFPGSLKNWDIQPGGKSEVKGSYNTTTGMIVPQIFTEITITNIYPGTDLRLYSGDNGSLEFDWLVNRAADYSNIRMNFDGQNELRTDKKGNLFIDLHNDDMKITMPETYQVINGVKKILPAKMQMTADNKTIRYKITGDIAMQKPLVIDPVMSWSTYMHNNTKTFDEYLYTVAANAVDEIYACGLTSEEMSSSYLSNVVPGFSGTYTSSLNSSSKPQTAILYKLNSSGTEIRAWTYTGITANVPVAMAIFPNNNVLVVYQKDTVQIFSPDLMTRHYSDVISSDSVAPFIESYQSVAIADDNTFYLGGIASSALSSSVIPTTAPDTLIDNREGVILRITNVTTVPTAEWGTYVGGSSRERFTAIALTPDKSKLAFAVHSESSGSSYPALVNEVDDTIGGNELLVGVFTLPAPTSFDVFSYLGGSANEGSAANISSAALVTADNNYFYVAGNTLSITLPGTDSAAQQIHGLNNKFADQFLSRIPLNGSAGSGFRTTYNGGNDVDLVGGLVIDSRTDDVLLFGTTVSSDFPVYSPNPYTPYYQDTHGSFEFGTRDITYTIFTNDLKTRKYSTYIGGSYDDYLGSTGKLEGTGHFQYSINSGLTYIGTTIHSDQTSIPEQWMSAIPGFDKVIPPATKSKDSHYIFAINPNTSDYGDAPTSYDDTDPANSAASGGDIRIGLTVDAESKPNPSDLANGDDLQNYGSDDDEDGVLTAPSMYIFTTTYSLNVSVFNNTGADVQLCGWIDTDGNGIFDTYEYAMLTVSSASSQQDVVLNFSGLPPFVPMSGITYLRLRMTNVSMTAADARGAIGKGEVEDYIVPQAVILPLTVQKFTATLQNEAVLLNWLVSNETDLRKYDAEYSTDNRVFTAIGTKIQDNSGNYSLIHLTPAEGNNFYRIKMTAVDGSITYTPSRKINIVYSNAVTIHPNPAKDLINIYFNGANKEAVTITVLAADGKVIAKKSIASGNRTESIDASNFAKGYYFVKINTVSETVIKTIQVTH